MSSNYDLEALRIIMIIVNDDGGRILWLSTEALKIEDKQTKQLGLHLKLPVTDPMTMCKLF